MPKRVKEPALHVQPGLSHSQVLKKAGKRLKRVRELASDNQDATAEAVGIQQPTWSRYELGKRQHDLFVVLRFCEKYDVSLDFIYRGSREGIHPDLLRILQATSPDLFEERRKEGEPADLEAALTSYRATIRQY